MSFSCYKHLMGLDFQAPAGFPVPLYPFCLCSCWNDDYSLVTGYMHHRIMSLNAKVDWEWIWGFRQDPHLWQILWLASTFCPYWSWACLVQKQKKSPSYWKSRSPDILLTNFSYHSPQPIVEDSSNLYKNTFQLYDAKGIPQLSLFLISWHNPDSTIFFE
jgi:hypothetical protein